MNLLTLSPDGRFMAVASQDRTVRLFDLATREQTAVLTGLRRPATSLCFLADGGFLATVCQENAVQLWDLATGSPGATLWGPADESFVGLASLRRLEPSRRGPRRRPHPRLGPGVVAPGSGVPRLSSQDKRDASQVG